MEYARMRLELDGPVGVVEFDRPPANAYDLGFLEELDQVVEEVRRRDDIKVLVLRGNDRFFSAGADINIFLGASPEEIGKFALFGHLVLDRLERLPKISIAAITGHAMGGGLEIALACDLRFMAQGKAQLGLVEVKIGTLPNMGGTQRLPRLIGKARALEMMVTGRTVGAEEALALGLVNRIHPADKLLPETLEYAKTLARGATLTIGLIKQCVNEGVEQPLASGLALERACGAVAFRSHDFKEGSKAFAEKRAPAFLGR